MKNAILLAKNQEYVSQKGENFYFSTKYRISAQNRIRPSTNILLTTYRSSSVWLHGSQKTNCKYSHQCQLTVNVNPLFRVSSVHSKS